MSAAAPRPGTVEVQVAVRRRRSFQEPSDGSVCFFRASLVQTGVRAYLGCPDPR